MKSIIFIFITLSMGALYSIPLGSSLYTIYYVEIGILLVLLGLVISKLKDNLVFKVTKYEKIGIILWGGCIVYSLLTYYWSTESNTALTGFIVLTFGFITIFISNYHLKSNADLFLVGMRVLNVILLIQLMYNMIPILSVSGLNFYSLKIHADTLIGNSNYVSFYFTFGLLLEFIGKEHKWMFFSLIYLLGLIMTMSRGGIITLILCLIIYFLIIFFNRKTKKMASIISLCLLFGAFLLFIKFSEPGVQLWEGLMTGLNASSVGTRSTIWNNALENIKNNPLGNGIVWIDDPHNIILRSLRDLGLFFGSIFIILIIYPIRYFFNATLFKLSNKSLAVLIAYLSVFIHSMIEIFYLTSISIIWVVLVLTYLNISIRKDLQQLTKSKRVIIDKL